MTHKTSEFLQILQRTADCVWAVDADQRVVLWNEAAEEFLGYCMAGRQQGVIRRDGLPGGLYLFRIEGSRGTLSGGRVVIGN